MKSLKKNIVLLLLIFLSCNSVAQIIKMNKGQFVPYDTAAVMPIDTYRTIRHKVTTGDNLVDSLILENESLTKQSLLQDSTNRIQAGVIMIQQNALSRKDSVNNVIVNNFNALYHEVNKPKKWYENRYLHLAIAVLIGWTLAK